MIGASGGLGRSTDGRGIITVRAARCCAVGGIVMVFGFRVDEV